jgi:hypothetical protein
MGSNPANFSEQFPVRAPIGKILIDNGCIRENTLLTALARQKVESKKIGSILTSMNLCSGRQVAHALALQNRIPWLCLENSTIEHRIIELIPQNIALQFKLLPVFLIKQQLVLATEDPLNPQLIKVLAGLEYQTVLAAAAVNEVEALLALYYRGSGSTDSKSQTDRDDIRKKDQREWSWPETTGKKAIFSSPTLFDVSKAPLSHVTEVADLYRSAKTAPPSHGKGSDLFSVAYPSMDKDENKLPFAGLRPEKTELKDNTKKEDSFSKNEAIRLGPSKMEMPATEMAKPARNQNHVKSVEYFEAGIVKLQTGYLQEALELFKKSSALDPLNRVCKANIKRIQQQLKGEDIKGF